MPLILNMYTSYYTLNTLHCTPHVYTAFSKCITSHWENPKLASVGHNIYMAKSTLIEGFLGFQMTQTVLPVLGKSHRLWKSLGPPGKPVPREFPRAALKVFPGCPLGFSTVCPTAPQGNIVAEFIFNRPSVAGAVLQTALWLTSFIHSVILFL